MFGAGSTALLHQEHYCWHQEHYNGTHTSRPSALYACHAACVALEAGSRSHTGAKHSLHVTHRLQQHIHNAST